MGYSHSKAKSTQTAEVDIAQIYKGTCDVKCDNSISGVTVDIINSVLGGGIVFSQSCSTNGNCIFGNTMDASTDVMFKATNSSNAKNAWSGWALNPGNIDISESSSRQDIREAITESVTQRCDLSSYNQMNDISIFTANSQIGGGIEFKQKGQTQGKCILDNSMSASAFASGMAQNTAQSGKDKKASKFGDKSEIFRIIVYVAIGMVVLIVTIIVAKITTSFLSKKTSKGASKGGKGSGLLGLMRKKTPRIKCPTGEELMFNPATRMYSCVKVPGASRVTTSATSSAE